MEVSESAQRRWGREHGDGEEENMAVGGGESTTAGGNDLRERAMAVGDGDVQGESVEGDSMGERKHKREKDREREWADEMKISLAAS